MQIAVAGFVFVDHAPVGAAAHCGGQFAVVVERQREGAVYGGGEAVGPVAGRQQGVLAGMVVEAAQVAEVGSLGEITILLCPE